MKTDANADGSQCLDFANEKISKLFRAIFFPTLVGMVFNAVLTLIDGIFVGRGVGANGIAAVNIVAPLFMLVTGIGLMFGIGASVMASIRMANREIKAARVIATQAFVVGTVVISLILLPCLIFPDSTVGFLGSSGLLRPYAIGYMLWLMPGMLFLLAQCVGMMLIRLDGSPKYAMMCNVVSAILNIGLDYLFVFPLGMGVEGAAIATSVSCIVGGMMALVYFARFSHSLRYSLPALSARALALAAGNSLYMTKIGFATFLTEMAMGVMMLTGNYVFMEALGENGVAAFSIACYLFPVIFSMSNAVAQSAQPIISYNYGAGNMGRVSQALRVALITGVVCGIAVCAIVAGGARVIVGLFLGPEAPAYAIACSGLPKYAICSIFFALNIVFIGYYQSLEKSTKAIIYTALRGIIFIVPLFIVLPRIIGVPGLWYAIPLSEFLTLAVIVVAYKFSARNHSSGL